MSEAQAPGAEKVSPKVLASMVGTLAVGGFVSGLALVGAYVLTKPIIEEKEAQALRDSVFDVVPESTQMQPLTVDGDGLRVVGPDEDVAEVIYAAYDDAGLFKGYAIPAEGTGYQDIISLIYGYDPAQGLIVGMSVLASKETPGLGDKIYKDATFAAQWSSRRPDPELVATKAGEGTEPNQVDTITGATISSSAVIRIVNESHPWLDRLYPTGHEPPLPATGPAEAGPAPDAAGGD